MTEINSAAMANVTGGLGFFKSAALLAGGELLAAGALQKLQGGKNCYGVVPVDSQLGRAVCPAPAPAK